MILKTTVLGRWNEMPFGGPNQQMRGWSRRKLEYLQSYISAYCRAAKRASGRFYIDGFAGPGRLPDEETGEMVDGSPLIALSAEPRFSMCHLIEMDEVTCERLRENTQGHEKTHVWNRDCNELIPTLLKTIPPGCPILVVLDPTGVIGQVKWTTIEAIAQRRTEIILNFPYHMAVQRLLPNDLSSLTAERTEELGEYLPPGWEQVYRNASKGRRQHLCRDLLDLYRNQLRALGYAYVVASAAFRTEENIPLYYLVWAGRHPVGARIAQHVFLKQFDSRIRLFGIDDDDWLAL